MTPPDPADLVPEPMDTAHISGNKRTVDENIQAYVRQNAGNSGKRNEMLEAYARRKRREDQGYMVGF